PSIVACRTIIGKGAPNKQGTSKTHGSPLGKDEVAAARVELGWEHEPFVVPADIAADWRQTGERGRQAREEWQQRLAGDSNGAEFRRRMEGRLPTGDEAGKTFASWLEDDQKVATRRASELVLEVLTPLLPEMVGGSADLTGSNNTKTPATPPL